MEATCLTENFVVRRAGCFYSELTEIQQATVKTWFVDVGPEDGYLYDQDENGNVRWRRKPENRTGEEIDALISEWISDPCWHLEDSEGFEAYRQYLLEIRLKHERNWEEWQKEKQKREQRELLKKSTDIGCEGNLQLAAYVLGLERRLQQVEALIGKAKE